MEVELNVPYRFDKGLIAAHHLEVGKQWHHSFFLENQAHATGGGWLLIQGFYKKATRPLSEVEARRKPFKPPHDVK
jgi:hypothetical protein